MPDTNIRDLSIRRKKAVDESGKPMSKETALKTGKTIRRPKIDNYTPVRHRSSKVPFEKNKSDRIRRW